MRSEPARLGGISLDFAGIPPGRDEHFPYELAQVGQPGKSALFCFFRCSLNNIRTFVLHDGFTSLFIVKTT